MSWENVEKPFEVNRIASEVVNPAALPVMVVNQPSAQSVQQPMVAGALAASHDVEPEKNDH